MRIAYVPLDSRPVNWRFPRQLAEIAGVELLMPDRSWLGTLHHCADGRKLVAWLTDSAPHCDAAVFSWDALVYGGLVQSRDPAGLVNSPSEIEANLAAVDWGKVRGYSFATLPRLGITVQSASVLASHQLIREYFIALGDAGHPADTSRVEAIAADLGADLTAILAQWRQRNLANLHDLLAASARLGLRQCHVAVEDNAPRGPHLDELSSLWVTREELLRQGTTTRITDFDGADECGCLLLATAFRDVQGLPELLVRLEVHPSAPGPETYTGRFESRTLEDGLLFLARQLGLCYSATETQTGWLVAYGLQPQPDLFEQTANRLSGNPFLLPESLPDADALYLSDLCTVNGCNPDLAVRAAQLAGSRLHALVGLNTNFNTLGVTAALIRLGDGNKRSPALRVFVLERLADDLGYQTLARPEVIRYFRKHDIDPFDFAAANSAIVDEGRRLARRIWRNWALAHSDIISAIGASPAEALSFEFEFPWQRAFECEISSKR